MQKAERHAKPISSYKMFSRPQSTSTSTEYSLQNIEYGQRAMEEKDIKSQNSANFLHSTLTEKKVYSRIDDSNFLLWYCRGLNTMYNIVVHNNIMARI